MTESMSATVYQSFRRLVFLVLVSSGVVYAFFFHPAASRGQRLVSLSSRGVTFAVLTEAQTVGDMLNEQGMETASGAISIPLASAGIGAGWQIEYRTPVRLTITDGGKRTNVVSTAATVGDMLAGENAVLHATDRITPELGSFLHSDMQVQIDRIVEVTEVVESEIPFSVRRTTDPQLLYGQEVEERRGQAGKRRITYQVTYTNGIETRRKKVSSQLLQLSQPEVIRRGTKIVIEERVEGRASWYRYKECLCGAHPSYPSGSFVRVTNRSNGRSVIVRINDRGPDRSVHPGRVVDLDATAFRLLASLSSGTISVTIEKLKAE